MKHVRHWLLALACAAGAFQPSQAQVLDWTAVRLPTHAADPGEFALETTAVQVTDINNAGQVVGWSSSGIDPRAFLYRPGLSLIEMGLQGERGLPGTQSQATAINGLGQVVGWATSTGSDRHAFVWNANLGAVQLPSQGGRPSEAVGINDRGQIITRSPVDPFVNFSCCGAVHDGGTLTPLGGSPKAINQSGQVLFQDIPGTSSPPTVHIHPDGVIIAGGFGSSGTDLNDAGQAVGVHIDNTNGQFHAFRYTDGQTLDLGTLGGRFSEAVDVNNVGQVVGNANTADQSSHAFVYADGVMRDLGTLGGRQSFATAINEHGQVVGFSEVELGSAERHAFFYSDGKMVDLTDWLELSFNDVAGLNSGSIVMNDLGQIALDTLLLDGTRRVFVLTQIPEPSTYALMLTGLGALALIAWRMRTRSIGNRADQTHQPKLATLGIAAKPVKLRRPCAGAGGPFVIRGSQKVPLPGPRRSWKRPRRHQVGRRRSFCGQPMAAPITREKRCTWGQILRGCQSAVWLRCLTLSNASTSMPRWVATRRQATVMYTVACTRMPS